MKMEKHECDHCGTQAFGPNAGRLFSLRQVYGYELYLCRDCDALSLTDLSTTQVDSFNLHGTDVRFNTMGEPC